MTDVTYPPGWYADPAVQGQWRWFDGAAWTEHVSAPAQEQPVPAAPVVPAPASPQPAMSLAPAAAPAFAVPSTPYTSVVPLGSHAAAVPWWRRTSPLRLVVITVVVLAGLVAMGAMTRAGSSALRGAGAAPAAGPALDLGVTPPATLAGLARATDPELTAAADDLARGIGGSFAGQGGVGTARAQAYGVPGVEVALLGWLPLKAPMSQALAVAASEKGQKAAGATGVVRTEEGDGGSIVCGTVPGSATSASVTECQWIRSGTGLVQLIELEADTTTVAAHTRAAVHTLTAVR